MKNANSVTTIRPLMHNSVNLVRLALALSGATRIEEVLGRALDVLSSEQPEMAWAILHRIEAGKYRAATGPGVSYEDIRALSDRSCGMDNWLSLGTRMAPRSTLGEPAFSAIRAGDAGQEADPDLVLAQWTRLGESLDPGDPYLETAARLIASSASTATVFEYLLEQSFHDPLTGLLNRMGILELLEREAARARRNNTELSVLFLDLDRFKEINDLHGHAVGDGVLRTIAGQLSSGLRASDAVGRIGGDEFLVVLPETDLRAARRIGRRLSRLVENVNGRPMGLSFGGATLEEVEQTAAMVEKADQRMLSQKRRKQNQRIDRLREPGQSATLPIGKA